MTKLYAPKRLAILFHLRRSILALLIAVVASWSVVVGSAQANSTVGAWSLGPMWADIAPIHMMVLPTGKVMFWSGDYVYGDNSHLWDPDTNTTTLLATAGYDLFCAGHSFMADGTIFVPGGNLLTPFYGLPNASIYNPFTDVWTRVPDMNDARWYPTTTTTGQGEVLVMTGTIDNVQMENPLPQVWQPASQTWRNLTNALLKIYNYSWVYWTPFGNAVVAGPRQTTRYLDISGTGAWTDVTSFNFPNVRDYGSSVMYSPWHILIAGGGQPPTNTAEILDLSAPTPTWQYTNPMAFPRRHMNMTLLPDNNVLVTGGTSADGFNNTTQPVYASEMWNPTTQAWTTMASQTVGRFYHSNALLLPDGRVLSAGGNYTHQTEIYSPPYLFKGARPTITSAPPSANYSETFFLATPTATSIANVRLIRLPAVTHAFDQNQRIVTLSFTQTTGGLNVTAPADPNRAPPGHYMLFILNGTGVPSVAKIIQIGVSPAPPAAPTNLAATPVSSSSITLTWTDQSNNESSFKIERALGAGAFSQVATVGAGFTTYTDGGLTASTGYSYRVRASNATGDSAYSNTASATTLAPATAPAAPTGLVATAASNTMINLTWTDQSNNETGFTIERAVGAGVFSPLITVGPNVATYANTGLTANTSYSYRVRATNSGGDSPYSNMASATTSGLINVAAASANGGFAYFLSQNFGTPGDTSAAPTQSVLRIFENSIELGPAHTAHATIRSQGLGRFSHWGNALYFSASNNTDPRTNGRTYTYRIGVSPAAPPTAPTGLTATATSNSAISLTWLDQSTNESGFRIERALSAGAFSTVTTVGPNITTYSNSGLSAGTSYSYRLVATNSAGDSAYSNTASETTFPPAPAAPSGLTATAVSSSAITLTWADQSTNEDGFKIERALGAGAFTPVATVLANVTTYTDDQGDGGGLAAATTYSYRVRASNTGGDSAYTNTASDTTFATIPAAPMDLTATAASSSTITLTWTDQSTDESGFNIERKTGAGAFSPVVTVSANITTWTDSGLTASTAYSYRVAATNTGGDSAYTNTASATTEAPAPTIPAAPTGLGATATSSSGITLTWADQSTNESGFNIERRLGAGAFSFLVTVGTNVTTYADSGLTASTAYSYRVAATNSAGDSSYTNTASATTHADTIPAPPTGLGATAVSSSAINLVWTDAATNEDGFKIERKIGAGAFSPIATIGPNVTAYADSGLTASTAYSYRVAATNTAGDSAFSNTASATTQDPPPTPPAAPTGLGATAISSSDIILTWADQSANEEGFKIERAVGAGAFSAVVTVGANVTTYTDSGLTAGTAYSYRVAATNIGGDSPYTNTAGATTQTNTIPAPPTGLGATAASSSTITLTWADQSTNELGFKIERALGAGSFSPVVTVGADITTYTDSSLTPSTAYSYRVAATNSAGDSAFSNTASATTQAAPPTIPAPPTGLGATATSSSSITLTWVDQSTDESGFKIERALGAGAFSPLVTVVANVTTYTDNGLVANTAYSYRVAATNSAGDSAFSNTASATTQAAAPTIPAPPTGLGATATSSSTITLTWADQSTDESGFKIERALGAEAFSPVVTVSANITTYSDSGLTASTAYSYRVAATNTAGDSAFSNTANATTDASAPTAPAPPTGLGATAISSSAINLSWTDAATNEDGYKIERAVEAGPFSPLGTVGPNSTTYTDSGLTGSTTYSYQVRAYNSNGDSTYSNTASATTQAPPPTAPAPPTGLGATTVSSNAINLSWTDAADNEDGYKIERAEGAGPFGQVATAGPNSTTYADSGLTASTEYTYQVRAYNSVGDSAYSNPANATTQAPPPTAPAPPSGLGATAVSSSAINLNWTDAATNEDGFKIERAEGAGPFSQVATTGQNSATYADNSLAPSTTYTYQVRSYNSVGDSTYSNTATATTQAPPPTTPGPPTGLGATAISSSAINLSWTDAANNEDGYKIERAEGAGPFSQVATAAANSTTYADSGLTASTAYTYQVRAYNSVGDSTYSNTASATTQAPPPTAPAPPTGLGATAVSSSAINLSWSDAATNEDGFKIERAEGAGPFSQVATTGQNGTTYTDGGLIASTAYRYQVRAYNSVGDSTYSNTASATTQAPPPTAPAPPTGLGATAISNSAITLSWTDAANNEDGFKIERAEGAGPFSQVATAAANSTTYADSGLTASTAYTYQVRAYNSVGDSAYSNTASATTQSAAPTIPAAPAGLGAAATSSSAITLTWVDQSTNESGFKIERAVGAGAFSPLVTVGANVTTYPDTGLTANSSYSYRVRATNTGGDSAYSNTASATTSGVINVAAASSNGGFAYTVNQNFGTPGDTSAAPTQSVLRIFENSIELGPPHTVHANIRSSGAGRFSHWGNNLYFSASDNTDPRTNGRTYTYRIGSAPAAPPAAPTGLTANATSSSTITLAWTDQSTNESGFKIERALGAGAFSPVVTVAANVTTYTDSGLTASTAYTYRVAATNTSGDSAFSNTASATTQDAASTIPAPPTGLGATATSSSAITLTWADQANNESGFKIERALGAGAFSPVVTVGANITTYADSGLTASTSYTYRVAATNTSGDSAYSNTASATTAPTIPVAPTGLGATATSSSTITLTWADQSNNESGFKIERALGAGAFGPVVTVGANVTTYADSGLSASTAYTYRVAATNTAGDSAFSNTANATTDAPPATPPAAPTGLGATATSSSTITLTWADQSNNESGFKIERALGAGAFSPIVTVAANITTYADSGLTANTAYTYRVRATNTGGDSAYTNTASATTSGVINVAAASSNGGFAYTVNQNFGIPGDTSAAPSQSVLRIFENGVELGPPHTLHADIRSLGLGRFSHWGNNLYFSASNNTDPRTNGRTYTYRIGP